MLLDRIYLTDNKGCLTWSNVARTIMVDDYPTPAPSTNPNFLKHHRLCRIAWVYKLLNETLSDLQISRMPLIIQYINGGTVYVRDPSVPKWREVGRPDFRGSVVFYKVV